MQSYFGRVNMMYNTLKDEYSGVATLLSNKDKTHDVRQSSNTCGLKTFVYREVNLRDQSSFCKCLLVI